MEILDLINYVKQKINLEPNNSFEIIKENVPHCSMYEYILQNNKNNMSNSALRFGRIKYTYHDFFDAINMYAKGFKAVGIKEGDIVGLLLPNLPESTIIIYALNKIGAISDNIDPTSKPERLKYFFEKEKISALICFDSIYNKSVKEIENYIYNELGVDKVLITGITDSLPFIERNLYKLKKKEKDIVKELSLKYEKVKFYSINNLLKNIKYELSYTAPFKNDTVACICHSSGTEGVPKTLPSTNENVNFISFQHQISDIDYSRVRTFLHILPAFAKFGFTDSMHLGHSLGLEMIEVPIFSHEFIIDIMNKTKPNCIFSDPSLWLRLANDKKYENIDLSYLYEAVYGGGRLTQNQVDEINRFLVTHGARCLLRVGYGLSEFDGTCILEDPFTSTKGSSGKDLVGGHGLIINPETHKVVPNNTEGHLYYSKGSMPVCEYDGKVLHEKININGRDYIDTGDIFTKNDDEEYFFLGRESGMICRYDGYKVYPATVENAIAKSNYVDDCMVSEYYEEEKYGSMPIVYIKPSQDFDINNVTYEISNIINNCILDSKKASYKDIPRKWKIVTELPMTSAFKKDYKKIKSDGLDGSEITVICDETNIGLNSFDVIIPESGKKRILSKKGE